jgi:hypothetical protein
LRAVLRARRQISKTPALAHYTDTNGEEVTGADLEFKIQNLDVDALNDIVGTFLADDMLPACTP